MKDKQKCSNEQLTRDTCDRKKPEKHCPLDEDDKHYLKCDYCVSDGYCKMSISNYMIDRMEAYYEPLLSEALEKKAEYAVCVEVLGNTNEALNNEIKRLTVRLMRMKNRYKNIKNLLTKTKNDNIILNYGEQRNHKF